MGSSFPLSQHPRVDPLCLSIHKYFWCLMKGSRQHQHKFGNLTIYYNCGNHKRKNMINLARGRVNQFSYMIRAPFDLKQFRPESLATIKKSLAARFRDTGIADNVSGMLQLFKKNLYELEQMNKQINQRQKNLKELKMSSHKSQALTQQQSSIIAEMSELKTQQKQMELNLKQLTRKLEEQILKVGNIVDSQTPVSQDEALNTIQTTYAPPLGLLSHSLPYSEICQKFALTDLKRGQKVGGHRGYFLKNGAVKLALALANYGLQFLQKKGYEIYQSPAIIAESILKGSCQLQSIEQDVYKLEGMDSYLIATSQQSLAGLYKDEVLKGGKLPIRLGGYSTCFRKEAGAHGKDIHGLFRVHQFEKVQQFAIVEPEQSSAEMRRMMGISEQFYQSLEIPYRVVNIVSGELNDAASCKFDLQAWYPSQKRYRQLVSVSNCTEYQSRLLKVQYSDGNNELKHPHMLNGTLVAIQRALTCIVENSYREDHLVVPKVLQGFAGIEKIVLPGSE